MTDNYLKKPIKYKTKKILRYFRMYGLTTTVAKMRGQLHMNKIDIPNQFKTWENPKCKSANNPKRSVAIIGCGNFAYTTIARYCAKEEPLFLHSAYDLDQGKAISLIKQYNGAKAVASVDEIAEDNQINTIFIASNHASHAPYAMQMIEAGKNVHIEKPHVVSEQQLVKLVDVIKKNPESKVYLGFNRPHSQLFHLIDKYLAEQTGSLMINWFIAGHEISDDHWYYSQEEGGRILGNLCHWTDLTLRLVGLSEAFPVEVIPGSAPDAKSDFAINYRFADGSLAVITFSAKGHSFEGVREWLSVHKGDAIIRLTDFQSAQADIGEKKLSKKLLFRDHGHRSNIINSLKGKKPEEINLLIASAMLFLASREAVESGCVVTIDKDYKMSAK